MCLRVTVCCVRTQMIRIPIAEFAKESALLDINRKSII